MTRKKKTTPEPFRFEIPESCFDEDTLLAARSAWMVATTRNPVAVEPDGEPVVPRPVWDEFAEYKAEPVRFADEVLGFALWEGERAILESARDNIFVAIRSARKTGKTRTLAILVVWLMCTRECVVITLMPGERQLKTQLWAYVAELHLKARRKLPGKVGTLEWRLGPRHAAYGMATKTQAAAIGFHAEVVVPDDPDLDVTPEQLAELARKAEVAGTIGAELWVIVDETVGVEERILGALLGSIQGGRAHMIMSANPLMDEDAAHTYADAFRRTKKGGGQWFTIKIAAEPSDDDRPCDVEFDHVPNWLVTPEYLRDARGVNDSKVNTPRYQSDVRARFSSATMERQIVPRRILVAAIGTKESRAKLRAKTSAGRHIGLDLSGGGGSEGGDSNVAALWDGGVLAGLHEWKSDDLMANAGLVLELMQRWGMGGEPIPARNVHIDKGSMGGGVIDRLRQLGYQTEPVDFGGGPEGDWISVVGYEVVFLNRRAELMWNFRRLLEEGLISVPEAYLDVWRQAQWHTYEEKMTAGGTKLKVAEAKEDIKASFGRSPDHFDAAIVGLSRGNPVSSFRVIRNLRELRG